MRILIAVMTVLALTMAHGSSGLVSAASAPAPALRVVHVAKYQLAVAGQRWGQNSQVTVTVHAGTVARHIVLKSTAGGSFVVGINGLDRCSAVMLTARDSTGRHRTLRTRKTQCAGTPSISVVKVLKGQTVSPPVSVPVVGSGVTGNWKAYTSAQGGFTVEYPSTWTATERTGSNGEDITTFQGSDGSFTVTVIPGVPADPGDKRIGNVYCHQITVAGLPAQQCLDTIAFTTSAILSSHNKTYTIAARVRGGDAKVYEHALATFHLTG